MPRDLDLGSSVVELEIDHYTVHPKLKTLSIHYNAKRADGSTSYGDDIDRLTEEELGFSPGEGVSNDQVQSIVQGFAPDSVTVKMAEPEPEDEPTPE